MSSATETKTGQQANAEITAALRSLLISRVWDLLASSGATDSGILSALRVEAAPSGKVSSSSGKRCVIHVEPFLALYVDAPLDLSVIAAGRVVPTAEGDVLVNWTREVFGIGELGDGVAQASRESAAGETEIPKDDLALQPLLYDYSDISDDVREKIEPRARVIKYHLKRGAESIIAIGAELLEIKRILPEGNFTKFCREEFEMSERHARNFMAAARSFPNGLTGNFQATAVYALASESVSEAARAEAIERAESGEKITSAVVTEIITKHTKEAWTQTSILEVPGAIEPEQPAAEIAEAAPEILGECEICYCTDELPCLNSAEERACHWTDESKTRCSNCRNVIVPAVEPAPAKIAAPPVSNETAKSDTQAEVSKPQPAPKPVSLSDEEEKAWNKTSFLFSIQVDATSGRNRTRTIMLCCSQMDGPRIVDWTNSDDFDLEAAAGELGRKVIADFKKKVISAYKREEAKKEKEAGRVEEKKPEPEPAPLQPAKAATAKPATPKKTTKAVKTKPTTKSKTTKVVKSVKSSSSKTTTAKRRK